MIQLFQERKVRTVWDDQEGNQTVTNCNQLKLRAEDGRMRLTDVVDMEQLFSETRPLTICHLLTGYRNCLKKMNKQNK